MKRLLLSLLLLAPVTARAGPLAPTLLATRTTLVYFDSDGLHFDSTGGVIPYTGEKFAISDSVDARVNAGTYEDALLVFDLAGVSPTSASWFTLQVHSAEVGGPMLTYPIGLRFGAGNGSAQLADFPEIKEYLPGPEITLGYAFDPPLSYDIDVTGQVHALLAGGERWLNVYVNLVEDDSGTGPASMLLSVKSVPEPSSFALLAAGLVLCTTLRAVARRGR